MTNLKLFLFVSIFSLTSFINASSNTLTPGCHDCWMREWDEQLGYTHKKSFKHRGTRICDDGSLCYQVEYQFDEFRRRKLPNLQDAKKHLMIFGCSIAFGEGLPIKETLAYKLQKKTNFQVYNYAQPGESTSFALARIHDESFNEEVPQKNGHLLFIATSFHIFRNYPLYSRFWSKYSPYYELKKDGSIIRKGFQNTHFKNRIMLYNAIRDSQFSHILERFIPWDGQFVSTDYLINLYTKSLKEIEKEYLKYFDGNFTVVLITKDEISNQIAEKLKELKISFIHFDFQSQGVCHCDSHPDSKATDDIVNKIINNNIF